MKPWLIIRMTVLPLFCFAATSAVSQSRLKLVLSTMTGGVHEELTHEVYETLNRLTDRFEFEIMTFPPARATVMADSNKVDGAALRARNLSDSNYSRNLIRVPTPLATGRLRLVIRNGQDDLKSWEELQHLRVGVRRASPAVEGFIPEASRIEVTDEEQALKMLLLGRVDAVGILDAPYFNVIIDNPELGSGLRFSKFEMPCHVYMFVNTERKDLIPMLDAAIQKAVATGELQKTWNTVVEKFRIRAEMLVKELSSRKDSSPTQLHRPTVGPN